MSLTDPESVGLIKGAQQAYENIALGELKFVLNGSRNIPEEELLREVSYRISHRIAAEEVRVQCELSGEPLPDAVDPTIDPMARLYIATKGDLPPP